MCDDTSTYIGVSSWTLDGVDADIVRFATDGATFYARYCGPADLSLRDQPGDLPPPSW